MFGVLGIVLGPVLFAIAGAILDWRRFVAAVFAGRLVRFLGEAYLAVRLGDRAAETLREHDPWIAGAFAAAVVLYLLLRRFGQRRNIPLPK